MPQTRFSKRIDCLIQNLEALPHSEFPPETKLKLDFYPFSNERNLGGPIKELRTLPVETRTKTIRVAVLIGESSFGSLFPELSPHCDVVIFADINPYLMLHTRRLHALLTTSTTMTSFQQAYKKVTQEAMFESFKAKQSSPDLNMRIKTLGKDHFLSSKARFMQCQRAAQTKKVAFCHTNLFDENDRKAFFECLKKNDAKITFFNATNLYEWDAQKSLAKVNSREEWQPKGEISKLFALMDPCPIIMASLRENMRESCPLSTYLFYSYQKYINANQSTVARLFDECFPLPRPIAAPSSVWLPHFQYKKDSTCMPNSILTSAFPTSGLALPTSPR